MKHMSDLINRADAINAMCNKVCGVDYCGCDINDCPDYRAMVGVAIRRTDYDSDK